MHRPHDPEPGLQSWSWSLCPARSRASRVTLGLVTTHAGFAHLPPSVSTHRLVLVERETAGAAQVGVPFAPHPGRGLVAFGPFADRESTAAPRSR